MCPAISYLFFIYLQWFASLMACSRLFLFDLSLFISFASLRLFATLMVFSAHFIIKWDQILPTNVLPVSHASCPFANEWDAIPCAFILYILFISPLAWCYSLRSCFKPSACRCYASLICWWEWSSLSVLHGVYSVSCVMCIVCCFLSSMCIAHVLHGVGYIGQVLCLVWCVC